MCSAQLIHGCVATVRANTSWLQLNRLGSNLMNENMTLEGFETELTTGDRTGPGLRDCWVGALPPWPRRMPVKRERVVTDSPPTLLTLSSVLCNACLFPAVLSNLRVAAAHLTTEEAAARRGCVTCPQTQSEYVMGLEVKSCCLTPELTAL